MVSANVLWLFTLPLVATAEGWLLKRWGWSKPYQWAFLANLLSMLAALPIGLALTQAGLHLVPMRGPSVLQEIGLSQDTSFFIGQVLVYGRAQSPGFGYAGGGSPVAGTLLAALLFMAICWLVTAAVEGWFLATRNRAVRGRQLWQRVVKMHLLSYGLLAALWVPFAYAKAQDQEEWTQRACSVSNWMLDVCLGIWEKYPQTLADRKSNCEAKGVPQDKCPTEPHGGLPGRQVPQVDVPMPSMGF